MKKWILVFAACIVSACGASSDVTETVSAMDLQSRLPVYEGEAVWSVDKGQSTVSFDAVGPDDAYKVVPFTGTFRNFAAAIKLDVNDLASAKIMALIDTGTAELGAEDRQNNWPGSVWADVKNFPVATFESGLISQPSDGQFVASGRLTVKGISKDVDLPFNLTITDNKAVAVGEITLNRLDFKLGDSSDFTDEGWVKFPVTVRLNITATR